MMNIIVSVRCAISTNPKIFDEVSFRSEGQNIIASVSGLFSITGASDLWQVAANTISSVAKLDDVKVSAVMDGFFMGFTNADGKRVVGDCTLMIGSKKVGDVLLLFSGLIGQGVYVRIGNIGRRDRDAVASVIDMCVDGSGVGESMNKQEALASLGKVIPGGIASSSFRAPSNLRNDD